LVGGWRLRSKVVSFLLELQHRAARAEYATSSDGPVLVSRS
jgi:hypothetical protein